MNGICTGTLWPGCYLFPSKSALRDLNKRPFLSVHLLWEPLTHGGYLTCVNTSNDNTKFTLKLFFPTDVVTQWVGVGCSVQ